MLLNMKLRLEWFLKEALKKKNYESVDPSCVNRLFIQESEKDATNHETKAKVMVL